jgi:hypothetical protein
LAFAINQRPVSRDASSIAQTDVQHFADEEVMRNSRASLAEVATSTGFADQHPGPRLPPHYRDNLKHLPSVVATISSEKRKRHDLLGFLSQRGRVSGELLRGTDFYR